MSADGGDRDGSDVDVHGTAVRFVRSLGSVRVPLFDDRLSRALFLGAICWFALTWRVGFFIMDSYAVANTLINVADGHLYVSQIEYSTFGSSQPGLHIFEGRVYGRNYGQVYLALPLYWLLEGLSAVVDLRVGISGLLSLALLGCAHQVGGVLDRKSVATIFGSGLASALFVSNLFWARSLDPHWTGLLALQGATMIAGAVLAVLLYRLFRTVADRRVGLAVGTIAVVATPVGFWATIPKRHVLTASLTVAVLYGFFVSRRRTDPLGRWSRAGAYAAAGVAASVHGGEGAVLLFVLLPVDLLTAPSNARRPLVVAAGGLLGGLLPFLVTNWLVSGNPFLAPRWLGSFNGGNIAPDGRIQAVVAPLLATVSLGGEVGFSAFPWGRSGGGAPLVSVGGLWDMLVSFLAAVREYLAEGLAVVTDTDRLSHIFVRSGRIDGIRYDENKHEVVELAVLESMPIAGGFLGVVAVLASRWAVTPLDRLRGAVRRMRTDPARQTDLLALGLLAGLTLPYLPRLPLFSQITVRYLLPTMPLWVYLLARVAPVRRSLSDAFRHAAIGYLIGVSAGGLVLVGVLTWLGVAVGEAMQFHALLNLALAALVGVAVPVGDRTDRPAVGAVAIGLAAAGTTLLLALAGLEYFDYGETLLPIARFLSELLPLF